MSDIKKRRKYLRCKGNFPVRLKVLDRKKKKIWTGAGSATNIGGGGALLEIRNIDEKLVEELAAGEVKVLLAMEFPGSFFRISIGAKIIWFAVSGKQGESATRLGVSFENISEKKRNRIADYVEERVADELASYSVKRSFDKARER